MLLTKASEYALLSLIIIADKKIPQDVDTLSTQLGISKSFLAKILQNLAREGVLLSFKGVNGGFTLAVDAKSLNLKQIIESAEKKRAVVFECSTSQEGCPQDKAEFCRIWPTLNRLQTKIDDFLDNITLADIIKE